MELYKKWTQEIEDKVNEILGNTPEPDINFRSWGPYPFRRQIALKKS